MKSKILWIGLLLSLTFLFLFRFYPFFFLEPNEIIPNDKGDCLKSFFVSHSFNKNQEFGADFKGMNYPYGLTFLYTDGLPALTFVIHGLSFIFPGASDYTVAFYNLSFLLSYFIAALLLFKILKSFYLNDFFSVMGAFSIVILSPQIFRVLGHPTLVYVAFFPLAWYLSIRFFATEKKPLFTFLMMLNSILWFFMHPYYQMIITMFYLMVWVFYLLFRNEISYKLSAIYFTLQVILPVVITRLIINSLDHHTGRPQIPGGFFDFYARIETVFVPYMSPFTKYFVSLFNMNSEKQIWEGWAYIGLPAVFMAIFLLLRQLIKILRYKKKSVRLITPFTFNIYLFSATVILIFSFCIPFKWGFAGLLDYLPFIKQFRALGRFAWVFYYVFSVFCWIYLYIIFRRLRAAGFIFIGYLIVSIYFSVIVFEAYGYHKIVADSISSKNPFIKKNLPASVKRGLSEIKKSGKEYQCIIPIPFFHSGSEEFEKSGTGKANDLSMLFSYWSKTPLMASATARTPILEGRNILGFFSPPFMENPLKKSLEHKPFLVLSTKEDMNSFETNMLAKANRIAEYEDFDLYELPFDSVFKNNFNKYEWLKNQKVEFTNANDSLWFSGLDIKGAISQSYFAAAFDSVDKSVSFTGQGSFKGIVGDFSVLADRSNLHLDNDKKYIVSGWYLYSSEKSNHNSLIVEEADSLGENADWLFGASTTESYVHDDKWIFVQKVFSPKKDNSYIKIFLKGADTYRTNFNFDQLRLQLHDENIVQIVESKKGERVIFYNNMPFDTIKK